MKNLFLASAIGWISLASAGAHSPFEQRLPLPADRCLSDALKLRGGGLGHDAYDWYSKQCKVRPIRSKSITAGLVSSFGDVVAQIVETAKMGTSLASGFDAMRTLSFFLCGLLFIGPLFHWWYERLYALGRWMETEHGSSKRKQTIVQLILDQTIGVWVFFPSYFFVYEVFEALVSFRAIDLAVALERCRERFPAILILQYLVFPLANGINFTIVPEGIRMAFINTVAVLWNVFLCSAISSNKEPMHAILF